MATGNIYFRKGTKEQFESLQVKDSNTIYFLEDTKEIYKGEERFAAGRNAQKIEDIFIDGLMSAEDKEKLDGYGISITELEEALPILEQDLKDYTDRKVQDLDDEVSQEITTINNKIDSIEGRTVRLLYDEKTDPTAREIKDFVIASGYSQDKWANIAVVVYGTYHIWHYYENDGWQDDGLDTVKQFTNDGLGTIKGDSSTPGKISAEQDGTGSVNGWGNKLDKNNPEFTGTLQSFDSPQDDNFIKINPDDGLIIANDPPSLEADRKSTNITKDRIETIIHHPGDDESEYSEDNIIIADKHIRISKDYYWYDEDNDDWWHEVIIGNYKKDGLSFSGDGMGYFYIDLDPDPKINLLGTSGGETTITNTNITVRETEVGSFPQTSIDNYSIKITENYYEDEESGDVEFKSLLNPRKLEITNYDSDVKTTLSSVGLTIEGQNHTAVLDENRLKIDGVDPMPRVFFGVSTSSGVHRTAELSADSAVRFDEISDGDILFVRFQFALTNGNVGEPIAVTLSLTVDGQLKVSSVPIYDAMPLSESTSNLDNYRPRYGAWGAHSVVRMVYRAAHDNVAAYFMASGIDRAGHGNALGKVAIEKTFDATIDDYRLATQKAVADFFFAQNPLIHVRFRGSMDYDLAQDVVFPRGKTFNQIQNNLYDNPRRVYTYTDEDTGQVMQELRQLLCRKPNDSNVYITSVYMGIRIEVTQVYKDGSFEIPLTWDYVPSDGEIFYTNDE